MNRHSAGPWNRQARRVAVTYQLHPPHHLRWRRSPKCRINNMFFHYLFNFAAVEKETNIIWSNVKSQHVLLIFFSCEFEDASCCNNFLYANESSLFFLELMITQHQRTMSKCKCNTNSSNPACAHESMFNVGLFPRWSRCLRCWVSSSLRPAVRSMSHR